MQRNLTQKNRYMVTTVDPHIKKEVGYFVHDQGMSDNVYFFVFFFVKFNALVLSKIQKAKLLKALAGREQVRGLILLIHAFARGGRICIHFPNTLAPRRLFLRGMT